jgi:hypothetical protein
MLSLNSLLLDTYPRRWIGFDIATLPWFGDAQINDSGLITAVSVGGNPHALLLTPATDVPSVPEPSSLVLLGLGALGLIGEGLRRRRA